MGRKLKYEFGDAALTRPIADAYLKRADAQQTAQFGGPSFVQFIARSAFRGIERIRLRWVGDVLPYTPSFDIQAGRAHFSKTNAATVAKLNRELRSLTDRDIKCVKYAEIQSAQYDLRLAEEDWAHMLLYPEGRNSLSSCDVGREQIERHKRMLPVIRDAIAELERLRGGVASSDARRQIDDVIAGWVRLRTAHSELLKNWTEWDAEARGYVSVQKVIEAADLKTTMSSDPEYVAGLVGFLLKELQKSPCARVARSEGVIMQERLNQGEKEEYVYVKIYNDYFGQRKANTDARSAEAERNGVSEEGKIADRMRKAVAALERADAAAGWVPI